MVERENKSANEFVVDPSIDRSGGGVFVLFSIAAFIAVIFCLFMIVYNFTLSRSAASLTAKKADLVSQIETPENQQLAATIFSTANAISNLNSLYNPNRFKDSDFLTEFPKVVSKNVMIQNLSLDDHDNLKIDGTTAGMTGLATFMESLKQTNYITDLKLLGVTTDTTNNQVVTKFSLSAYFNRDQAHTEMLKKTTSASTSASTTSSDINLSEDNPNPELVNP